MARCGFLSAVADAVVWAEMLLFPLLTPVLCKKQPWLDATVQDPAWVKVVWGA